MFTPRFDAPFAVPLAGGIVLRGTGCFSKRVHEVSQHSEKWWRGYGLFEGCGEVPSAILASVERAPTCTLSVGRTRAHVRYHFHISQHIEHQSVTDFRLRTQIPIVARIFPVANTISIPSEPPMHNPPKRSPLSAQNNLPSQLHSIVRPYSSPSALPTKMTSNSPPPHSEPLAGTARDSRRIDKIISHTEFRRNATGRAECTCQRGYFEEPCRGGRNDVQGHCSAQTAIDLRQGE
jgi:hypothetical protein